MALSAELLAAIAQRQPLATLVTITLPASVGGDLLLSDRPFVSHSAGVFHARLVSLGKLARKVSEPDGQLDTPSITLRIVDQGWRVQRLGHQLDGTPVHVQWGAEGVAPAAWSTRFRGHVVARKRAGRGDVEIICRIDDRWLERPVCPRIDAATWPTAQAEASGSGGAETVLGRRAPIAYGTCDSTGLGSHGLRRLLWVQTAGPPWRWLYSIGDADVTAVYVDGQPASGWTRVVEYRGGWWWTTVDFAAMPWGAEDAAQVVTADGDGVDVSAFGEQWSAVAQLRHALEAFGRGGWDGKAGLAAQLTDATTWDALEVLAATSTWEGAGVLGGEAETLTLRELLARMLSSWGCSAWWTREGTLAIASEQWARTVDQPTPGTSLWLVEGESLLEPVTAEDEGAQHRAAGLRLRYCHGADGQPLLSVTAMDPLRLDEEPEEITMPLGPQRVI